ncbi:hypothetical protein M422DRAFT_42925 [Sphaerobolus stellatus SS14]|nr:hypothetical protein M422DRAFT_42925 [Sphaerobolus stellatus SS14]
MADVPIFQDGNTILVIPHGPGKLHLFSWGSTEFQKRGGFVGAHRQGKSRFVIGFSYSFTHYAFFWEGEGEAHYRTSNDRTLHPVGKTWKHAIAVEMGKHQPVEMEVTAEMLRGANLTAPDVTCYLLPERI